MGGRWVRARSCRAQGGSGWAEGEGMTCEDIVDGVVWDVKSGVEVGSRGVAGRSYENREEGGWG